MKKRTRNQFTANRQGGESALACFYSNQYEYRQINTAQLRSNQGYQRPVSATHVHKIVENFDPLYLEEIVVSFRDGRHYVIDGQNRIAACKYMNNGRDCLVNCKVFTGLTYEQEADMFYHLDSIKKNLRFCDSVRARAEAKNDATIIGINMILSRYGVKWSYVGAGSTTDFTLKSSKALVDSYEELGQHMFDLVIRLLDRTWDGDKESMTSTFIRGLSLFVKTYVHEADEEMFVRKLKALTPAEVKSLARAETSLPSVELKFDKVFYTRYNFRAGASSKLEYRLE